MTTKNNDDVLLRYAGGSTLTFRDGAVRRTVRHGEQFTVSPETARLLLDTDPAVEKLDPKAVAAIPAVVVLSPPTVASAAVGPAAPHVSSSEANPNETPAATTGAVSAETSGTDELGMTPGGGVAAAIEASGTAGTAPTGVVRLGDLPDGGKKSPAKKSS